MGHLSTTLSRVKRSSLIYEEFSSLHEMASTIKTRPYNATFVGREISSESNDSSFTRTRTYAEAEELMLSGWTEPLGRIEDAVKKSEKDFEEFHAKRVMPKNSYVGVVPNVPRAMYGLPDSMIRYEREREAARTVHILYNISASGSIGQEELLKSGIAVLSAINLIEKLGVRVRLDLIEIALSGNDIAGWGLMLKDYRNPIDLKKICFPISHPSMLRRIAFRWMETVPDIPRAFYGGYGTPYYRANENDEYMDLTRVEKPYSYLSVSYIRDIGYDVAELYRYITGKAVKNS